MRDLWDPYEHDQVSPLAVSGTQVVGAWSKEPSTATDGMRYLGIFLTASQPTAWQHNLVPLTEQVQADMKSWSHLPLNLFGCSAIFKMVSLPRLLYQLHNQPYPILATWFRQINVSSCGERALAKWRYAHVISIHTAAALQQRIYSCIMRQCICKY